MTTTKLLLIDLERCWVDCPLSVMNSVRVYRELDMLDGCTGTMHDWLSSGFLCAGWVVYWHFLLVFLYDFFIMLPTKLSTEFFFQISDFIMTTRNWNIVSWNVRGINSVTRWNAIRSKIMEFKCDVLCLQETKRETFNETYLRSFCPTNFNQFNFVPSNGNSGGLVTIWNKDKFKGEPIFQNRFAQYIELQCKLSGESWIITNIYAPCTPEGKLQFLNWFKRIEMQDEQRWLIVGDFNLMRKPEDRNKPGGDIHDMLLFNEAISRLRLNEIQLKGGRFTWTNKQVSLLLQRLDWFFTSSSWIFKYPNTCASILSRDSSDHNPCVISISNSMPAPQVFRFENYWLHHDQFHSVMQRGWNYEPPFTDKAKVIGAKFKNLRRELRSWKSSLPSLAKVIQSTKEVLIFLDVIEESRDLSLQEWNFRSVISSHLASLLQQ